MPIIMSPAAAMEMRISLLLGSACREIGSAVGSIDGGGSTVGVDVHADSALSARQIPIREQLVTEPDAENVNFCVT